MGTSLNPHGRVGLSAAMIRAVFQKQKSLLGWRILSAAGPLGLWLLIAGGMLGGWIGISMLLVAIVAGWLFHRFGNCLLRLPFAGPNALSETTLQSQRACLPLPRVYEAETSRVFAQSRGPDPHDASVILTSGILGIPQEERGAVIAHELAHVGQRDSLLMTAFGTTIASFGIVAIIADIDRWFVGVVLVLLVGVHWWRELRADSVGAHNSGDPMALANALRRMRSAASLITLALFVVFSFLLSLAATFPQDDDWLLLLFVTLGLGFCLPTHPPTFLRIWRLKSLARRQT